MSSHASDRARVIPLRPAPAAEAPAPAPGATAPEAPGVRRPAAKEPLWRHVVGGVLRGERLAQERTLKDVAEAARISMPYLSEVERGRKEASSEVLAAAAQALGLGLTDVLTLVQSELARHARRGSSSGVRRAPAPATAPSAPAPAAPAPAAAPGGARPGGAAAAESDDGTAATSVSALSTRHSRARPAGRPRHGDVRLAA